MVHPLFPDIDVIVSPISSGVPGHQSVLLEVRNTDGSKASDIVNSLRRLERLAKYVPIKVTRKEDRTTYVFRFLVHSVRVTNTIEEFNENNPKWYVQQAVVAA